MPKYATATGIKRGGQDSTKAPGAEVASTTHAAISTPEGAGTAVVTVLVTAQSGSPTMTVIVEGSVDDGATWINLITIGLNGYLVGLGTAPTNITASGTYIGVCHSLPKMRTRSVIGGGTPSLTYGVTIESN